MSSEYFFFVAEASAISSAPKTMSRGTFFSRASTSTSMTSSRLPAAWVAAAFFAATLFAAAFVAKISSHSALRPALQPVLQHRYQLRPIDIVERQRNLLFLFPAIRGVHFHHHLPVRGAPQHAYELAPARRVRRAHPHLGLAAREAREIARLAH